MFKWEEREKSRKAIHPVMTFVRDRLIIISHKGKVTSKIADLWKRHKTLDTRNLIKHDNYWQVLSSSDVK